MPPQALGPKTGILRPSAMGGRGIRWPDSPRRQSSLGSAASLWNFIDTVMRQTKLPGQNFTAKPNSERYPGLPN